jgi:methyl-accepting chemotaxis protein/ABC-type sugar transport system substrate-binding protein
MDVHHLKGSSLIPESIKLPSSRSIWIGSIFLQIALFILGFLGYFTLRIGLVLGCLDVSVFCAGLTILFLHRDKLQPSEEFFRKGRELYRKDLPALTTAIGEVAQGNLSVRVESEIKPIHEGDGSGNSELFKIFNNIAFSVQNAVHEFNQLTEEPCNRLCYVGTDSFLEGRLCGETMAQAIKGNGLVAISTGKMNAASLELRRKGFLSLLTEKYHDIKIVEIHENQRDLEIAYKKTLVLLKRVPLLAGIYVTEGYTPLGVAKAVREMKKAGKVKIIGHDLLNSTMQSIKDGLITATISQDPFAQGYDPMIHLFNHIVDGWKPVTPRVLTRMEVVDAVNYRRFWDPEKGPIQSVEEEDRLAKPVDKIPTKPLRLVFEGREDSEFWLSVKAGVLAAAEKLKSYGTSVEWKVPSVSMDRGDFSATPYKKEIESLVKEKADGIAVFCGDPELIKTINMAVETGIPVITANSEPFNLRSRIFTVSKQAQKLMDVSLNLADNSSKVSSSTSQISATLETITDRTLMQNDQFQNAEIAINSLLANINQIHWEARRSAEAAQNTVKTLGESNEAINKSLDSIRTIEQSTRETWDTIQELARHSERIDAVVDLIDEIASQVNVLALNAAIEATRAGESGRGFMVVSNEVRNLSKKAVSATAEIAAMMEKIKKGIDHALKAMDKDMEKTKHSAMVTGQARSALDGNMNILNDNRRRMQIIVSVISEIQSSSKQVSDVIKNVARTSAQNTESIKEINTAAEILNVQFKDVADMAILLEKISKGEQELLAKFTFAKNDSRPV